MVQELHTLDAHLLCLFKNARGGGEGGLRPLEQRWDTCSVPQPCLRSWRSNQKRLRAETAPFFLAVYLPPSTHHNQAFVDTVRIILSMPCLFLP